MNYGCSLPPAYLYDETPSLWSHALGSPDDGLELLKAHGIDCIELRALSGNSDPVMAIKAIDRICEHGMAVTVHGSLMSEAASAGLPHADIMDVLDRCCADSIVVTVHCIASKGGNVNELIQQTVDTVTTWLSIADKRKWSIKLALEINRAKDIADPGNHYEGLLAVKKHLPDPRVGFCWDLGHTAYNVLQGTLSAQTPDAFVRDVIHTHIHGLSPSGQTHWPLGQHSLHVESWLQSLLRCGYEGVLNLELDPVRFKDNLDVKGGVLDSIKFLRSITQ